MSERYELLPALRAARAWLDLVVEHLDIDPETTRLTVTARTPESRRVLAGKTFAASLAEIDAVLEGASTSRQFGEWFALDSAPANESVIVFAGGDPGGSRMQVGEAYHYIGSDGDDEGWWWANTAPHDFDPSDQIYPLVWMPLPPAPKFEVTS